MADAPKKGIWNKYTKTGDTVKHSGNSCPKCGPGFFLAQHKSRSTCGGCGYTEFHKKEEVKKEEVQKNK